MTITRLERKTASGTEWVTNSPAKGSRHEQREQLVVEALAGDLVEGAERLVEEEQLRAAG